jgi:hypothetical protein
MLAARRILLSIGLKTPLIFLNDRDRTTPIVMRDLTRAGDALDAADLFSGTHMLSAGVLASLGVSVGCSM